MQRRSFIKMSTIGAAVGIIMPKTVLVTNSQNEPLQPAVLGNMIFTADHQGRWAGKAGGHLPQIEKNGHAIQVQTKHTMDSYAHYIIKHVLFDENFQFIKETMFIPGEEKALSEYDVKNLKHKVHILSVCNVHDSWLNSITL